MSPVEEFPDSTGDSQQVRTTPDLSDNSTVVTTPLSAMTLLPASQQVVYNPDVQVPTLPQHPSTGMMEVRFFLADLHCQLAEHTHSVILRKRCNDK